MNALFSRKSVEWATPKALFQALDAEFNFDHDPCSLGSLADGTARLFQPWRGKRVFCNPPYGRAAVPFLERWADCDLAVYLLPSRTDTAWFHSIVLRHASEIRFVRGRIRFGNAKSGAPFPSIIVIFRNRKQEEPAR